MNSVFAGDLINRLSEPFMQPLDKAELNAVVLPDIIDPNIYGAKDSIRIASGNECEFLVSAAGEVVGPVASHVAMVLQGCR